MYTLCVCIIYTVCMYMYLCVLYTPSILILILSQCPSCSHEWAHPPSSLLAHCTSSTYIIYIIHITSHILYQTHCRIVHGMLILIPIHTHCAHMTEHINPLLYLHIAHHPHIIYISSTYHVYISSTYHRTCYIAHTPSLSSVITWLSATQCACHPVFYIHIAPNLHMTKHLTN